ncbi:CPBP family intramembrane glutamic endopeptidase [Nesterenkonia aerolata]|uniref:CPBP family intramembrane glutamic endopeptidase n=1 Tax=Nesterenkonia aerolata TaxID=3074079 RepID=A0ABU2DTS0_9MICC|nr:CPBP family intramembrane glutamic endopeptidase [Nesterenkonia sp. LY-0111]MDR8019902.1 CPBP family intramembrane glutamic endopeptidase [Nesterenkonia sp. LY-0111]
MRSSASPEMLPRTRRFYAWEVAVVLALSLGRSAVYSVLALAERLTQGALGEQQATLHSSASPLPVFDVIYQVLDNVFALMPVVLVLYLVFLHGENPFRRFGLDLRRPVADLLLGAGLFVLIGAGTVVVYGLGRSAGLTAELVPADLGEGWWNVPVLVLTAARHALLEEVVLIAYLFDRFRRLFPQQPVWVVIIAAAVLRGCYHLYQGIGPGIGNLLMGLVFGWVYHRYGRVMPLVVAHFLLDVVAFFAFPLIMAAAGIS